MGVELPICRFGGVELRFPFWQHSDLHQAEAGLGLEVRRLFDELARAAQHAAELPAAAWQPAGLRRMAQAIRGHAARVLEILRVEPGGDVDVADLNGLGPGQLLEALSPELQRHTMAPAGGSRPAAEARRAWALTAGRVLDVARRLEEAGQLEPQAEASEASADCHAAHAGVGDDAGCGRHFRLAGA